MHACSNAWPGSTLACCNGTTALPAMQIGLLAALPMVAAKACSWTDGAHERFPAMEQLQQERMQELQPLLASMSLPQVRPERSQLFVDRFHHR